MVKRYQKKENKAASETTETGYQYAPITIDEKHQIMGIVIAIAKLYEQQSDQS